MHKAGQCLNKNQKEYLLSYALILGKDQNFTVEITNNFLEPLRKIVNNVIQFEKKQELILKLISNNPVLQEINNKANEPAKTVQIVIPTSWGKETLQNTTSAVTNLATSAINQGASAAYSAITSSYSAVTSYWPFSKPVPQLEVADQSSHSNEKFIFKSNISIETRHKCDESLFFSVFK